MTKSFTTPWPSISSEQALKILQGNISGLSFQEATARLKTFGLNILPRSKKPGIFIVYLSHIGHMKSEGKLRRNYLKGTAGDSLK